MTKLQVTTTMTTLECCTCGVLFAITEDFEQRRQRDKDWFYCPYGHRQQFTGESDAAKIKRLQKEAEEARRLAACAQEDARAATASLIHAKGEVTKARNAAKKVTDRAKASLCPHPDCHRSFVQLARHIKSKHPELVQ